MKLFTIASRNIGTMIVTGSNSGIGKATATELAKRGAKVILACRDVNSALLAKEEIHEKTNVPDEMIVCHNLDLTSLKSVRRFANRVGAEQIDVLINNAGILPPPKCQVSVDGFEITFQTNFLGHFFLSHLLLDNLSRSKFGGRIINAVADPRAFYLIWPPYALEFYDPSRPYNQLQAYIKSKLAIALSTKAYNAYARDNNLNVSVFSVDPGVIDPSKGRNTSPIFKTVLSSLPKFLFKSFEQGAQTAIHCATASGIEQQSGGFFQNCKQIRTPSRVNDSAMAQRLWTTSMDLVKPYL